MKRIYNQLFLVFTAVILVTGWVGWYLLNNILKLENIEFFPLIPSFFFVFGISVLNVITRIQRDNAKRIVNIYMIIKISKILLSALFILLIYLLLKEEAKVMVLTFGAYYFIYMLIELYVFSRVEKAEKKLKENE